VLKGKLTLCISKYNFEYVCERKSWLYTCPNMTLSMFVKEKFDFIHVQMWLWVFLLKEKLTLDMSKYDFEYFVKRKVMSKYDFEYVFQKKDWL
jgi:hypothetical protein